MSSNVQEETNIQEKANVPVQRANETSVSASEQTVTTGPAALLEALPAGANRHDTNVLSDELTQGLPGFTPINKRKRSFSRAGDETLVTPSERKRTLRSSVNGKKDIPTEEGDTGLVRDALNCVDATDCTDGPKTSTSQAPLDMPRKTRCPTKRSQGTEKPATRPAMGNSVNDTINPASPVTSKVPKPYIQGAAQARNRSMPASFDLASPEDKMLWTERIDNATSWNDIRKKWTEITGEVTGTSTLPNRLERMKQNFETLIEDELIKLVVAEETVARSYEAKKWADVAETLQTHHGMRKLSTQTVKKAFSRHVAGTNLEELRRDARIRIQGLVKMEKIENDSDAADTKVKTEAQVKSSARVKMEDKDTTNAEVKNEAEAEDDANIKVDNDA